MDIAGCADFLKTIENNGEAYMWLYRYYKNGDPANSHLGITYLKKALSMNYVGSNYELGCAYFNGFCGVAINKEEAINIWKRGIELNDPKCMLMCAYDYLNGEISEKNVSYGLELLEKSSQLGDYTAKKELGVTYLFGNYGADIDYEKAFNYLTASSEGSSDADALLGYMYLNGLGVQKDLNKAMDKFDEAISYDSTIVNSLLLRSYRNVGISAEEETKILLKAANNNDTEAMVILYYQFKNGKGVVPDINQALDWLYKAVDMNDSRAYYELGNVYAAGNEQIERNEQKAFECYNHSFNLGKNANAAISIMRCYYFGNGVPRDLSKAEEWAKIAIVNGNRTAAHNLRNIEIELYGESQGYSNYINYILSEGINYNDEAAIVAYQHCRNVLNDYPAALNYLEKSFNNRNPDACFLYGNLFYNGEMGVQKDIDRAYQIWEIGVQANSQECIELVGKGYLMGEHYPKDIQKGLMYIRDAAHRGNKVAAYELGLYYMAGFYGVPIDTAESTKYVILAAQLGHTEAKNELGTYYMQGSNGLPKDIEKGVALVKEAADAGSANAQCNMGNFYYNGQGVNRDFLKSIEYYKKAEAQGHENATKIMELLRQQYTGI